MAFERHATSKLQTEAELYCIHTLGFRGEALASVAAVAKVTCTTKTADAEFGVRCQVEGGEFTDIRQAAWPVGTTFVVEDLFYNTPVRRKFLKLPAIEAGLVSDDTLRLILSHPEIAFRFVSQGKTIYHSLGDGKLDSALFCLYGKDAFRQMIPVSGHQSGVVLKGFIGVGELSRGNRQQQSFFINGRFFRSGVLSRALENGCEGRVMIGKFPMCALFLEMPYQNVDVNVHPNKLEVRFQDESAVAETVRQMVYDTLHQEQLGQRLRAPASEKPAPVTGKRFYRDGAARRAGCGQAGSCGSCCCCTACRACGGSAANRRGIRTERRSYRREYSASSPSDCARSDGGRRRVPCVLRRSAPDGLSARGPVRVGSASERGSQARHGMGTG